jgi:hypothetical protein
VNKLPSIQWYPGDWRKDPGVQSLDFESRGIWFEMLMLMFESAQRGKLTLNGRAMTYDEIAQAIGCDQAKFKQASSKIIANGVAKVEDGTGILINRRMVRDEEIRQFRKNAGSLGGKQRVHNLQANSKQKSTPSSSSSSSSSSSTPTSTPFPVCQNTGTPVKVWPPEDGWLLQKIKDAEERGFPISLEPIKRYEFWENAAIIWNGIPREILDREMAKMAAWMRDNPARRPTVRGTGRFFRTWIEKSINLERRQRATRS